MSRAAGRINVVLRALAQRVRTAGHRRPAESAGRILVAHHLLLGDTLMTTALLAKLRERHRTATLEMTMNPAYVSLYAARPYGVEALAFNPRDAGSVRALVQRGRDAGGYDLALVPGDTRFAWLAAAMGARHIVAHAGDRPARKNWMVDALIDYPPTPRSVTDLFAELVPGPQPNRFRTGQWLPPACPPLPNLPAAPYALLHVGASSPLKQWLPARWQALARLLTERGLAPVWSGGKGEEALVRAIDAEQRYPSVAGAMTTAALWHVLAGARLLVCPDTGVAHLGRVIGTPTVALFGPGSATVSGAGDFWSLAPFRAVTVPDFSCRDQRILFRREVEWVRRCGRTFGTRADQCNDARCMAAIELHPVVAAIDHLLHETRAR